MQVVDAHCHRTNNTSHDLLCVINGTSPFDWARIIEHSNECSQLIPAIGLHPWKVKDAPENWQAQFLTLIEQASLVGEIGLDRSTEGQDIEQQEAAFIWQLQQAEERNLPVSIHCQKATDRLLRILKKRSLPRRGVHLHAYSGSAEEVAQFASLGAYFSFCAGQLEGNSKKSPAAVRAVPADRILIETDAPDTLASSSDYEKLLYLGYTRVAKLRGISVEVLAEQVAVNFLRYFVDA